MATFQGFEDIEAWKKSRELARAVYCATSNGPLSKDYGLKDQLQRAAVSVSSNIAEGFERGGNREFKQFLTQAKGSAGEVKSQIYIAFDAGLIDAVQFAKLNRLSIETSNLLGGLIRYLAQSNLDGHKFKQPRTQNPEPKTKSSQRQSHPNSR